jgi:nitrate reductase NapAB chaperone NapD
MARAYLKIFVDHQDEDRILNSLMEISEVKMADLTMGDQDIIVVLEAETFDDIVQIVLGQIRRIPGIVRTVTNLSVSYK